MNSSQSHGSHAARASREVSADVLTDFPERFDGLENVIAVLSMANGCELKIERFRFRTNAFY